MRPHHFLAVVILAWLALRGAKAEGDKVEALARQVLGPNEARAAAAAMALSKMGREAEAAAPILRRAVLERDGDVQRIAGYALKKMGYDRSQFMPELSALLDSESADERARGGRGLGLTQEPRPDLVKRLRKLVKDKSPRVRVAASAALFHWNEGNATALGVLRKLWSSSDERVSNLAFEGLLIAAARGEKSAVRSLLEALDHESAKTRREAAKALARLANKIVLPVEPLVKALQDESDGVRIAAALALAMSKADAKAAVPALIVALVDPEPAVQRNAALALVNIGKDALPGLRDHVEDNDPILRAYIAGILGEMEEAHEEAIRVLEEFSDDELPSIRKIARASIRRLRKKMAAGAAD